MQVIVVTNRAGGCGKSVFAANCAAIAAETHRTLLIDLDEQADASSTLGVEETGAALANALMGGAPLGGAIMRTKYAVDIAPGGEALAAISDSVKRLCLRDALRTVSERYDVVVIDCPPSLRPIVHAAWLAAPQLVAIAPVDGPKALRGLARLHRAWADARLDAGSLRVALVRQNLRRIADRELRRQAVQLYGCAVLHESIRESVAVTEACAWQMPLSAQNADHPVTGDLRRLTREVLRG